ncbi:RNA-directed DNA polymerase -like protein [Trichinella sp. T9]|nr:RNA-directed DNA polymerase -like protein [Trichinella sp. T9]
MYSPSFIAPLWEFASVCIRENHTEPSYMVAHSLSVATKPYSDGEIVKARIVDAVNLNCRKRSDVKEAQPVFRIDEIPDMLAGPKWFSTLDFASGYWQAKVRSEDRPKAPFITFMSCRSDCPTLLRLFDDIYDLLKDLNLKAKNFTP